MSEIPGDLKFLKSHEWVRAEGNGRAVIGISDHAQGLLGDLVYVELPNIGDTVEVWLPGGNDPHPVEAEVVYIHDRHDRYVARLDPATAEAFRQILEHGPSPSTLLHPAPV